jgi:hypothetical protein
MYYVVRYIVVARNIPESPESPPSAVFRVTSNQAIVEMAVWRNTSFHKFTEVIQKLTRATAKPNIERHYLSASTYWRKSRTITRVISSLPGKFKYFYLVGIKLVEVANDFASNVLEFEVDA